MGEAILSITQTNPEDKPAPTDVIIESQIAERAAIDYDGIRQIAEKSIYACPDCGGGLWSINNADEGRPGKPNRYRCHVGHAFSEKDLVLKQGEMFESTLWTALRILEERRTLLKKMEDDFMKKGISIMAGNYKERAEDMQVHVDKLKEVLFHAQKDG